jgi:hypothetical protein
MQLPILFAGPLGHRRVYRTGALLVAFTMTAVGAGFAVAAVSSPNARVFAAAWAALSFVWAWRSLMVGIYVEQNGVKVLGFLKTKHVAWADIDRFAVMPMGNYRFVGHIVLRDGRPPMSIWSLAVGNRPDPEAKRLRVQRQVDELNQVLAQWRETTRWKEPPQDPSLSARAAEHAAAAYRTARAVLLTFGLVVWLIVGAVVALVPRPAAVAIAAFIGIANTLWMLLALRSTRNKHLDTPT